jgi:mono/diheme cytochrome c family protein
MEGVTMRRRHRIFCLLALTSGIFVYLPKVLSGQRPSTSDAKNTLYDQQRRGEFTFIKNCALCHLRDSERPANAPVVGKEAAGVFGAELRGIFKDPGIHEEDVRKIVVRGIPTMMPGFQYTLDSKEIDDLIAFFRVPYPSQTGAGK